MTDAREARYQLDYVVVMPPYRPTNGMRYVVDSCGQIGAIQHLRGVLDYRAPWLAYWQEPDPAAPLRRIGSRASRDDAIAAVLESHDHEDGCL